VSALAAVPGKQGLGDRLALPALTTRCAPLHKANSSRAALRVKV
jgi:hypothetical protein